MEQARRMLVELELIIFSFTRYFRIDQNLLRRFRKASDGEKFACVQVAENHQQ